MSLPLSNPAIPFSHSLPFSPLSTRTPSPAHHTHRADENNVAAWSDDNALGFTLLQGMIDDKTSKGRILLMKIIEVFPGVDECKGDELLEETVTGILMYPGPIPR